MNVLSFSGNLHRGALLVVAAVLAWTAPVSAAAPAEQIANGGFEKGREGWRELWTRDKDAGRVALDEQVARGGQQAIRVTHTGRRDWSLQSKSYLSVKPGDVFELTGWLKIDGDGRAHLAVVTYAPKDKPLAWLYGGSTVQGPSDWRRVRRRFIVPEGVVKILPRLTGELPATVWADDLSLRKVGDIASMRADMPETVSCESKALRVTLHTADGTLSVQDRRTGRTWRQRAAQQAGLVMKAEGGKGIRFRWHHVPSGIDVDVRVQPDGDKPELLVTLAGKGELPGELALPHPFVTDAGTHLIVPMNEGVTYPVDDASIRPKRLIAYGGHGICMAFWGVTDGKAGQMAILETPDDAVIRIDRIDGLLVVSPRWAPQRGRFGYERRLRYVFFDSGGYVAMCKRYRRHAQKIGWFRTLKEKRNVNPNVDLLIGAVNVWCWVPNPLDVARRMKEMGIERILWSRGQKPDVIAAMNEMGGILTSRYDIYQDCMNPANRPKLRHWHGDWTSEGWPDDIMLDEHGRWRPGWRVKGKDDTWYPCGVLCDRLAVEYAKRRVPPELKTHAYRGRFIDTTTASSWRECYHPDHPMTRTDSRIWKMKLLEYMSKDMKMVTGSETGHDASVPHVCFFEGMLSLGPYRVPDAGRNIGQLWLDELPDRVVKFQTGSFYRVPLWELVYHDCVVSQWYWGDASNKLPALWDRRDLINVLYGTPPMFLVNPAIWKKYEQRFAQSYKTVCPIVRAVGYAEMTDHRWLTGDRTVQQTRFANGVTVTVNFGDKPHRLPDGTTVKPMGHHVAGM